MLTITYKHKTYSWEEWQQHYIDFAESIESHNDFLDYVSLGTILHTYDKSYGVAVERLQALHELLITAKFSLRNAFKKFYDSNIVMPQGGYISHLLMRSHYLKNAIVWYNSCEDYVYQIISLSYDIHGVEITSPQKYKSALKNCNYTRIKEELIKNDSENAKTLLAMIQSYRFNEDVKYLRNNLANNLKHHANLQFQGLAVGRPVAYTELDYKTKEVTYNSIWTESDEVDIDETIELVKRVHNLLIKFVRDIVNFIDFEDARDADSWQVIKDKSSYRKINF
ncbi:hypothetical protein [Priestia megaterium]|uniref:hypothetical protein n=1 Tax=Priestia megaterium TaxID=1404 RepID=UPI001D774F68|nr:hypothetical protein [Priestia megaterium]CAH0311697.1 hypothetical protein SRABI82_04966 [Priestia megaterium]